MRRLTALGLAAFMLHLNVVRADAACAAHQMPASHETPATHDMAAMHAAHGGDASGAGQSESSRTITDDASCETPAQQDCCQAMTSCGPLLGFDVDESVTTLASFHGQIMASVSTRPLSRNTAPEPPPPRL